jgi:hypothetical protein
MLKKILLALLVLVAAFLLFVTTRPDTYHIERSATMTAPPEVVFARVNDLHAWSEWSPWDKLDPAMKKTFGGPESGPGASYAWEGNDKVGAGSMTIQTATRPTTVGLELQFLKPFKDTSHTTFAFAPEGAGTKVTWSMDGKNQFLGKVMCLFMDMDKEVGGDFEKGLASLSEVTAKDAVRAAARDAAEAAAAAADSAAKK